MASTLSSTFSAAHLELSSSSVSVSPARNARAGRWNSGRNGAVSCCQSSSPSSSCSSSSSANEKQEVKWLASRRDVVAGSISAISAAAGLFAFPALALLEADDDDSLLEKVKEDRKKRLQKRGVAISGKRWNDYEEMTCLLKFYVPLPSIVWSGSALLWLWESVQKAVYQLSKAGQAIDGEDYGLASSVLGTTDDGWIKEVKAAISKVNKNAEEEGEAANFIGALQALQSAVLNKDSELSKSAFVASGNALETWSSLTGLFDQIKGL